MAEKTDKKDNVKAEDVNISDIFTSGFTEEPSAEDVFNGAEGLDFLGENSGKKASSRRQSPARPVLTATMAIVLLLNIVFFAGAGVWL